eukprot:3783526-Pleurochrysis_carterae.AAC.1
MLRVRRAASLCCVLSAATRVRLGALRKRLGDDVCEVYRATRACARSCVRLAADASESVRTRCAFAQCVSARRPVHAYARECAFVRECA